jgi:hypothetical protein
MTEAEMLSFWETASRRSPLDRGVLAVASAGVPAAQAADLPLGEQNRVLAQLYCAHFGGTLDGFTECAACAEKLEFHFDVRQVAESPAPAAREWVAVGRWKFELPSSRAVAMAVSAGEPAQAGQRLLALCLREPLESEPGWSDEDMEAIEARLAEADALAEIRIGFACPQCGHGFEEALDLESFLWSEIVESARQLLDDIHLLASAYGWTEPEVLAMSPLRRSAYVRRILG